MISELLRDENYKVNINLDSSSFKSQMKKADKSGADVAIILGEDEVNNKTGGVKYLRQEHLQETVVQSELADLLNTFFTD